MAGRPAKPTELKRRLGNPGHRPLPKSVVALARADSPAAWADLPATGVELFQRMLDYGAASWISQTDYPTLSLLAAGWDEAAELREEIKSYTLKERHERRTARAELRELEKRITQWLSLLGFTPTDRARLGVAEVKARTKLEELADRRAKRLARSS